MDDRERHHIEWECASNTVRFYRRLDEIRGEEAAALFSEDGVWYRDGDDHGWTGRAEIAAHVNRLREQESGRGPGGPHGRSSGDEYRSHSD